MDKNTPKNYIKRLLGLPGELIAIFFGRLYHRVPEPNEGPFYDDLKAGVHPNDLWREPNMHVGDDKASDWFKEGKFKILRKPPNVIMALRRNVFDNDFQSADLKRLNLHQRWIPGQQSNWKNDDKTGFLSDAKEDAVDWLRYQHLVRPEVLAGGAKLDKMLILDSLDYNMLQMGGDPNQINQEAYQEGHWVGDLMLECNLEVKAPKGEFWFELSRGVDRFRACFDLTTGQCRLYREDLDKKISKLGENSTRIKGAGNYLIRFANIDARLTVWVDRELPFDDGIEYDPPEVRKPGEKISDDDLEKRRGPTGNDLQPASIGSSKAAAVHVTHLRLWRDIYYRTGVRPGDSTDHVRLGPVGKDHWIKEDLFPIFHKQRFITMYVQPGHYLCLGDNSQSSSDSRDWGLVPERLMLGRALLVYYPIERIGPIR
jgi:signal peptidase I